jgi:alpha-1,6-mannosyltransferase
VVGGPHNDAFAVLLATLGIAGVLTVREASAGASLVAAIAVKVSAGVAAPFALLGTARRGRLLAGALAALLLTVVVSGLAFGWHWLDALGQAGENQGHTSHLSIPTTVARITGLDSNATRAAGLALYAALVIYLLAWTYRGNDWLRATAWATTGLLLATAWLLPWYLLWPLPAAALSRDRALKLLVLALTAYQLGARIPL